MTRGSVLLKQRNGQGLEHLISASHGLARPRSNSKDLLCQTTQHMAPHWFLRRRLEASIWFSSLGPLLVLVWSSLLSHVFVTFTWARMAGACLMPDCHREARASKVEYDRIWSSTELAWSHVAAHRTWLKYRAQWLAYVYELIQLNHHCFW